MELKPVYVTIHAEERFRERALEGAAKKYAKSTILRRIKAEVNDAISCERRATRKPGWCAYDGTRVGRSFEGHIRYLWDAKESICFVASLIRKNGRMTWVIHTVLERKS